MVFESDITASFPSSVTGQPSNLEVLNEPTVRVHSLPAMMVLSTMMNSSPFANSDGLVTNVYRSFTAAFSALHINRAIMHNIQQYVCLLFIASFVFCLPGYLHKKD